MLKIDRPDGKPLPDLPLGRSDDLMVGETVIAIGNPFGYSRHGDHRAHRRAVDRELSFEPA